jgi:hypothetical protein
MKIGERKTIDGKTYHLLAQGLTKAEATRKANWQRKIAYARIEKQGRGNYSVWAGPLR